MTKEGPLLHSNSIRSLYPIALAHLTLEVCDNYLPVVYPILIATMGLSYAQVGRALSGRLPPPDEGQRSLFSR